MIDFFVIKKKNIAVLGFAFILSVFMEVLIWCATPPVGQIMPPKNGKNLYPSEMSYTNGYDISSNLFKPVNDDPQIGFLLDEESFRTISIIFEEPLKKDIFIQAYFSTNGEELSEDKQIGIMAQSGSKDAVVLLPENDYTHIRLDINGEFFLSQVYGSIDEPETYYAKRQIQFNNIFINWMIFVCAIEILFVFRHSHLYTDCFSRIQMFEAKEIVFIRKYGILFLVGVMAILIILQVNNSSMVCYNQIIPNNIAQSKMLTIGTPRNIRSDEYAVELPKFFYNYTNGKLSTWTTTSDSGLFIKIVTTIITICNPFYWGEWFLPISYAYSWKFVFLHIFSFYIFYKLFWIITKHIKFSIIASFLLVWSPGIQWWESLGTFSIPCGFVVFFYDFFCANNKKRKLLCIWGLTCCTSALLPIVYPAWTIPIVYFCISILVGIYITEKKINFKKADIPYIVITIGIMLLIITAYVMLQSDITKIMLETVYPGKRFSTGGNLPNSYWAHYLVEPFTTWNGFNISGTNQSEISQFLNLFPIPTILFLVKYNELKKNKVITILFFFNIICDIYMVIGIPESVAKYSLLSYSTSERMSIIWGFSSFILLLLESYYIAGNETPKRGKKEIIDWILLNISLIAFFLWIANTQNQLIDYIGIIPFSYLAVIVILTGNFLLLGMKRIFLTIMCILTIISGCLVHPLNFGIGAIQSTPLAQKIRFLNSNDEGNWIAIADNYLLSKYVYAQGVNCLNFLNWPPRFDLFEPLDESGEFRDVYNRYAHIILNDLTEEDTEFELAADTFELKLNVDALQIWDVKYVIQQGGNLNKIGDVNFQLLYHDDLDDINIYKPIYP